MELIYQDLDSEEKSGSLDDKIKGYWEDLKNYF